MTKHAHEPRHCTAADMFTFEHQPETEAEHAYVRDIDAYLAPFAAPIREGGGPLICFHCGSPLDAFKHTLGIGAAIEWGIVHGEGRCSGMPHHDKPCGWPYRGMHYAKAADGSDLFTLSNFFLAYHPDEVTTAREAAAIDFQEKD